MYDFMTRKTPNRIKTNRIVSRFSPTSENKVVVSDRGAGCGPTDLHSRTPTTTDPSTKRSLMAQKKGKMSCALAQI
jgi:hypothetical protein